ncbi:hypothetical protein BT96DRAFT_1019819 [Gymnopus androsaceus JB14]|uniref:Uncharacterized protein n=1 Tax=Gymnopus androsaceus JB14 TaxID=1447944 RepID=A0A6A4HPK6_9AGAR|nr:hypothetical protein BT96DRAFT_1019819 [Gymnopus androsaceus JB14]
MTMFFTTATRFIGATSTLLLLVSALNSKAVMGSSITATSSLGTNFTLAALNTTLSNANSTGAPLVLGEAGAIDGESFHVTSTYSSYPYNDYPSLGLVGGNLRAFDSEGNWFTNASAPSSGSSGEELSWGTSSFYSSPASTAFSAVTLSTSDYPVLAVNGIYDLWYLCPSDEPSVGQDSVYYNTTSIASSQDSSQTIACYAVSLNIVSV